MGDERQSGKFRIPHVFDSRDGCSAWHDIPTEYVIGSDNEPMPH